MQLWQIIWRTMTEPTAVFEITLPYAFVVVQSASCAALTFGLWLNFYVINVPPRISVCFPASQTTESTRSSARTNANSEFCFIPCGDSVRWPAVFCGVYAARFTPTRLLRAKRYGNDDYANSAAKRASVRDRVPVFNSYE